jgi:uncharacterized membrane protein
MKYAMLATATFLGTIALAAAIAMEYLPELTTHLAQVSQACGIVALALFMYYAIKDTEEMIKGDKNDRN